MNTTPQSPEYNYEVISRLSSYVIVIYDGDFILGSLKIDSELKLEEWKEKLKLIEVNLRPE